MRLVLSRPPPLSRLVLSCLALSHGVAGAAHGVGGACFVHLFRTGLIHPFCIQPLSISPRKARSGVPLANPYRALPHAAPREVNHPYTDPIVKLLQGNVKDARRDAAVIVVGMVARVTHFVGKTDFSPDWGNSRIKMKPGRFRHKFDRDRSIWPEVDEC